MPAYHEAACIAETLSAVAAVAAVRRGMLAATGAWRFLADAGLSVPIGELRRFFPVPEGTPCGST